MPLDESELFQVFEVGADSGVKAVFDIAEDSTSQYSRAQTPHAGDAREFANQLEIARNLSRQDERAAAKDKENIQVTISEDLADGHNANLDASLKLLSEDDPKLLLRSDLFEDEEIHIIQRTNVAPRGENDALQDYQMQLMLLEQQKKKRLVMARQKATHALASTQFDSSASSREYERRMRKQAIYRKHLRSPEADEPISKMRADHGQNETPTNSEEASSVTKRQKRSTRSKPRSGQQSQPNSMKDEASNKAVVESLEVWPILWSSIQLLAHRLSPDSTS